MGVVSVRLICLRQMFPRLWAQLEFDCFFVVLILSPRVVVVVDVFGDGCLITILIGYKAICGFVMPFRLHPVWFMMDTL